MRLGSMEVLPAPIDRASLSPPLLHRLRPSLLAPCFIPQPLLVECLNLAAATEMDRNRISAAEHRPFQLRNLYGSACVRDWHLSPVSRRARCQLAYQPRSGRVGS
eukprot:GHVU01088242.1.p1 GENE.GHVU01088242.1~~GHVU01088242.1.p1  ORF type:complete len:105 (+),score=1.19 GHVU01088242.1:627-941(+)